MNANSILAFVIAWSLWGTHARSDVPSTSILTLSNGNFVRGFLVDASEQSIRWQADGLVTPLEFSRNVVRTLHFIFQASQQEPENSAPPVDDVPATHYIELNNGDVLLGEIMSLENSILKLRTPVSVFELKQDTIQSITHRDGERWMRRMPDRLEDWISPEISQWSRSDQGWSTRFPGASLYTDLEVPEQALMEVELRWTGTPNFALYLATNGKDDNRSSAFSIESWGDTLVVQRQGDQTSDVEVIGTAADGSLRLRIHLDQRAGVIEVQSDRRTEPISLRVPHKEHGIQSGCSLFNRQGNVELVQLQVRRGTGSVQENRSTGIVVQTQNQALPCETISIQDGKVFLGKTVDSDNRKSSPRTLDLADVRTIVFPIEATRSTLPCIINFENGCRCTGRLVFADSKTLRMASPASLTPLDFAWSDVRSVDWLNDPQEPDFEVPPEVPPGRRRGKLELMDTQLEGWLADSETDPAVVPDTNDPNSTQPSRASTLTWKPTLAQNESPLRQSVFGRIVYRDLQKPPVIEAEDGTSNLGAVGPQMIFRAFGIGRVQARGPMPTPVVPTAAPSETGPHSLILRSGDTISCQIDKIDEQGVTISSSETSTKRIPHAHVKAIKFMDGVSLPVLDEQKRTRSLILPRLQRLSPPKHLVISPQGDILRTNVMDLRANQIVVQLHLDQRMIPRDRVAIIVWLHEDEIEGRKTRPTSDDPADSDSTTRKPMQESGELIVQTVRNKSDFSTFRVEACDGKRIRGTNFLLGPLEANLADVDQLLLGGFIQRAQRTNVWQEWRLTDATDPKFVQGEENGQESTPQTIAGTESRLVGQAAPDVTLSMLDSGKFRPKDHLGHSLVLDFWATWCGPCLQQMPQVDQVVKEFAAHGVQLVAINIEEQPDQVRAALRRRGLEVAVALDEDGVAAARFEATTAIPLTIVINDQGIITRVFTGTHRKFADQLRGALREVTTTAKLQAE